MKILFVGNSHTYVNEVPHIVSELFRTQGLLVPDVTMLTVPGMSLEYHRDQPQVQFNLKYGNYDKVVFQDVAHPFIGYDKLMDDVDKILPLVNRNKTEVCLYMTWASVAHPEDQVEMIRSYTDASIKHSTKLAKVGMVWDRIRYEHPEINLYFTDGEHASIYGSFLAAATIFKTLSNVKEANPNLSDSFFDSFDREKIKVILSYVNEMA